MAVRYGAGPTIRAPSQDEIILLRNSEPVVVLDGSPATSEATVKDRVVTTRTNANYHKNWKLDAVVASDVTGSVGRGQLVSIDPDIAVMDGNILTRVSDGIARVQYQSTIAIWGESFDVSTNSGDVAVSYEFVVGSLGKHIVDSTQALLAGHVSADRSLFSSQDHNTPAYTRNANCWLSPIDLTAISPWNSLGGARRGGIAISPRHVLTAIHYPLNMGTTVRFVANDNAVITRTVVAVVNVPQARYYQADIQVCLLDSDLPASITPWKFSPADINNYLPTWNLDDNAQLPVMGTNQHEHVICALAKVGMNPGGGSVITDRWVLLSDVSTAPYSTMYSPIVSGDSGNPIFVVIDGVATLLSQWTFAGAGRAHWQLLTEINSAMTTLGGGHSLSTVDLSSFPTYGA